MPPKGQRFAKVGKLGDKDEFKEGTVKLDLSILLITNTVKSTILHSAAVPGQSPTLPSLSELAPITVLNPILPVEVTYHRDGFDTALALVLSKGQVPPIGIRCA